ncbi:MAG TPA: AAA family ATPase [Syntrophorhabdaceae bacterium]
MYYEYWGLKKPPFDNVPDPSMYVDAHESVENTIAESLFAIEEGNECIAVIVGDVGLGKTLSLRLILDSLSPDRYRIAYITNPDMSFIQLLREIVGQLTGTQCEIKGKMALLETFNRLLFDTPDEGKKVLILIDEANALAPANLESLRLLTNMQDDNRNLFTLLLAGQMEFARRLEHPKRANLFQRVGTYNRIEKIKSESLVKVYVETRLHLAGAERPLFTDDAFPALWEYSEQGVPRLINKICKLSLKAGETNSLATIDKEVVQQIGDRFGKMAPSAAPRRKRRHEQPDPEVEKSEQSHLKAAPEPTPPLPPIPERLLSIPERLLSMPEPLLSMPEPLLPIPEPERPASDSMRDDDGENGCRDKPTSEPDGAHEIDVNGARIIVVIPAEIIEEAFRSSQEHRDRLAGMLAARALEENPRLSSPLSKDPVAAWGAIRDFILLRFQERKEAC